MFKLVLSYITKMKKNTIICIFGMMVSITLLFSLVQIGKMIIDSYKEMMLSNSNFDLYVDELDYDTMQEIYEEYQSKYMMAQVCFFATNFEREVISNEIIGVWGDWTSIFNVEIEEGHSPKNNYEIVVEKSYAEEKNLKLGDNIELMLTGGDKEVKVKFRVSGIISNTAAYSSGSYLFVGMDTAKKILDKNVLYWNQLEYVDYFLIDKYEYPEEEILQIYSQLYSSYGKDIVVKIKENETKSELYENKGSYYGMSAMIWGIIAFVAVTMTVFIYYMMNINLQGKLKQYGIIRALGGNNFDITKLIAYELLVYGFVGTALGCVAGILINKVFAKWLVKILIGEEVVAAMVSCRMILYVSGMVLVSMIIVWFCFTLHLRKKSPIELIRKKEKYVGKKKYNFKNVHLDLIANNCIRSRKNSRALIITMVLAGTMIILLMNGMNSLSFDVEKSVFSFSELEVSLPIGVEAVQFKQEEIEQLNNYAETVYMQNMMIGSKVYENGELLEDCTVIVYSNEMMQKLIDINGFSKDTKVVSSGEKCKDLKEVSLVVGKKTANVEIDEYVDANWSNLIGQRALVYSNYIIIGEGYAENLWEFNEGWSDLFLAGSVTESDVKSMLDSGMYEFYNLSNIIGDANKQLQGMLILIIYMIVSIVFLAVFLISSIVKENFEHRRKEIGMMRAIGVSKNQMTRILMGEILALIMVAEIIAVILSAPVSMYIYQIINESSGMEIAGFVYGIPLTLLLSGMVILINVRGCMKTKTIELLRCED